MNVILLVVIVIICLIVGAVSLLSIIADWQTDQALRKTGVTAQAEVTKLDTFRTTGSRPKVGIFRSSRQIYSVDYQFKASSPGQEEKLYTGSFPIREDAYTALYVGGKVQVRYLPESPNVSRPDDAYRVRDLLSLPALAAIAVIVVVVLLVVVPPLNNYMSQKGASSFQATITAIIGGNLTEIHAAMDSRLAMLQSQASKNIQHLSAADAGFGIASEVRDILYGQCAGNHFYAYIFKDVTPTVINDQTAQGFAYAYTPGATPETCLPEGWSVSASLPYGNDWYGVTVNYKVGTVSENPPPKVRAQ